MKSQPAVSSPKTNRPRPTTEVIDIHVHPRCDNPRVADSIISAAAYYGISRMCLLGDVLAFGYDPSEDQIRTINDVTIETVERHPDIFIGFCHLNPNNSEAFTVREIDRCIVRKGLGGIKLEVATNARDRKLDPIMRKAEELDVPVLHHTWYKTVGKAFNESDPTDIADLASRFPDVTIIMAHLSGCGVRGVHDIEPYSNVYVGTSGSQPVSGIVEYAVKALGAQRILYGSDADGRDFGPQIGRIMGARVTDTQKRQILCTNAKKLLKLQE